MKYSISVIILIMLTSACIIQWSAQDWKDNLSFVTPRIDQAALNFITELPNVQDLPAGTHVSYDVTYEGSLEKLDLPSHMKIEFTISGKDTINGITCTIVDVTIDMEMVSSPVTVTFHGKEWVDTTGSPVRMEGEATGKTGDREVPIIFTMERTGEDVVSGHECWVLSTTQKMKIGPAENEVHIIRYLDKKSATVIRLITNVLGKEVDTGYMEPLIPTEDLQWELGGTDTIQTKMGDYKCQIIYLKENNETRGTLWATKKVKAPLKYVFSYRKGDTSLNMVMILLEYQSGQ